MATQLGMPQLAPIALKLDMQGPVTANTLAFSASAGAVSAQARGTLDLLAQQMAQLEVSAQSPQLSLTPETGWQAVRLAARLNGKMAAPHGTAQLDVDQLAASGVQVGTLRVRFAGEGGNAAALAEQLHLMLTADGCACRVKPPHCWRPPRSSWMLWPSQPCRGCRWSLPLNILLLPCRVLCRQQHHSVAHSA